MGGDSAGVAHLDVTIRKDPKVFLNGKFLIGYTSSFRMGQILRFKFVPPPIPKKKELFEYMCTAFVDSARKALKKGGFSEVSSNVESGGTFLVGIQGCLFSVMSDFQVEESAEPFNAVGCGDSYALGALATQPGDQDPKKRVLQALQVAEKFSGGVRSPFLILNT
jgi:ATP-dependent protease HslVU (ClpYQ) peptidase subunit